ncbi:MAG: trypsin-like peptidase domain-containing protein [Actinomycetota bacterium]|nr:trypsin-like peptidase domain-containing protein [Actinomycetota bacterium]
MTLDTDHPAPAQRIATGRSWRDLPQTPPEVDEPGAVPDLAVAAVPPTTTRQVPVVTAPVTVELPPTPVHPVTAPPSPWSPGAPLPSPVRRRPGFDRWGWVLGIIGALALLAALFAWSPWEGDPGLAVPGLAGIDEPIADVAAALLPSVVQIERDGMVGSGFAYADGGRILTAAHVVAGAREVTVRTSDGRELTGVVLGGDPVADVAVVEVDGDIPAAPLSLEDPVRVGQLAIAIGSPLGFQQSVTSGIVSAVDRDLDVPGGRLEDLIQTDAPINQGNSGGPLADREGRVIGVNVAIASFSGGSDGLGFAVAIDEAVAIAEPFTADQPQPDSLDPESTLPGLGNPGVIPPGLRDLLDQLLDDPSSIQPDDLAPLLDDFLGEPGEDGPLTDPELRSLLDRFLEDPQGLSPGDLLPLLDDFLAGDGELDPMLEDLLGLLYDNLLGE